MGSVKVGNSRGNSKSGTEHYKQTGSGNATGNIFLC